MAKRKRKDKVTKLISFIIVIILALIFTYGDKIFDKAETYDSDVRVHFIDVGQGSATLVSYGKNGILIDTGEAEYGTYLFDYIDSCGVTTLDYVIASHPHSDHIGSMADIIKKYPIGTFIMPELSEMNTPTTRVYEKMLVALAEKDVNVELSETGAVYNAAEGISFRVFGPCEQVSDLNDMSVIVKLTVNGTSFMVLADAEKQELSSVYESYPNLDYRSDVLVMGHHGSSTSVHEKFLGAVNADVAVISCGADNKYGHPHREALQYVKEEKMTLYRTDIDGDIVFLCTSDGYERVDSK